MFTRLGIRIGFLIHDVSRLRRALFDARSRHLDISRSEAWVLTGVSRRRGGLSQTELARVLGLGKVATGEFVSALERKGYLVRRPNAGDRRAYRVQLTPQGRRLLARISSIVTRMNAEMFRDFTEADLGRFASDLKKLKLQLVELVDVMPERQPVRRSPRAPARVGLTQRTAKYPPQRKMTDIDARP